MSIEQNMADLTTAINNLTAVISSKIGAGVASQVTDTPKDPNPEAAPEAGKKSDAKPRAEKPPTEPAEAAKSAPPADTPATQEPTAAASGALDYDKDVKPAFLKLVQSKGRAAGRKIIDAFAPTKDKLSEAISTQEQFKKALQLIEKEMK